MTVDEARDAVRDAIDRLRHPPVPVLPAPTSFPRRVGPITPAQCRAARGLIRWTRPDLAKAAGGRDVTVRKFENDRATPQRANLDVMRRALEGAGALFIDENGEGPGVRLREAGQSA